MFVYRPEEVWQMFKFFTFCPENHPGDFCEPRERKFFRVPQPEWHNFPPPKVQTMNVATEASSLQ